MEVDFRSINYWTNQGQTLQKTIMFVVDFLLGTYENKGEGKMVGKLVLINDTFNFEKERGGYD